MEFFNSAVGVLADSRQWPWAQVLVSGALSTFWKVTGQDNPACKCSCAVK